MASKVATAVITVTTAGTRVPLGVASAVARTIIIQAPAGNTGKVYIGGSDVSATNGIELDQGESISLTGDQIRGIIDDISFGDVYVDAATNADKVRILYLVRKDPS